ncbi:MAG: SDR family oxidoreductase [Gemmatimonadetes bacterium]|jgi:uncharacterized protein YbjT (DUF2867 family)|nr:SDR family oxidoreductase [Gemmatimonadota bacterium]MBT7864197.1 SDR family oxidoreductase [Gemmatimonadota bacterium]
MSNRRILLTGATGYVGRLLRERLEDRTEVEIRCLVRDAGRARDLESPSCRVMVGDLLDAGTLVEAMTGVDVAYYMVHSMGASGSFEEKDRQAAHNFGDAARQAGIGRVVYLGGLGSGDDLSPHLRSRQEVGEILAGYVPTVELRASVVLGAGSLSFEMIRALVERLPVMVTPKWVEVQAQPIAIDDLLDYLEQSMDIPVDGSCIVEVGGADCCSYGDLMREYGRQRQLSRWMIPVPVLTPRLSGLWLGLVTPLYARVGRALLDSTRHPTVVENPAPSLEWFDVQPMGMSQAIATAFAHEDAQPLAPASLAVAAPARPPLAGIRIGNRFVDARSMVVDAKPVEVFAPIRRIGGSTGWYAWNGLWTLRGWLDLLVGGQGMTPGRRDPEELTVGDTVDCWTVEEIVKENSLLLRSQMRLPGRAWLHFEVTPLSGGTQIRQTAVFDPRGLLGLAYWYLVCPLHGLVFRGMLRGLAQAAKA